MNTEQGITNDEVIISRPPLSDHEDGLVKQKLRHSSFIVHYSKFKKKVISHTLKILIFWLLFFIGFAFAEPEIPLLKNRITDFTGSLTSSQINELEFKLKTYEDTTSNQIVVLIINTLDDHPIEDYSIQVVEKNKIGQKDKNNGLLLL